MSNATLGDSINLTDDNVEKIYQVLSLVFCVILLVESGIYFMLIHRERKVMAGHSHVLSRVGYRVDNKTTIMEGLESDTLPERRTLCTLRQPPMNTRGGCAECTQCCVLHVWET